MKWEAVFKLIHEEHLDWINASFMQKKMFIGQDFDMNN